VLLSARGTCLVASMSEEIAELRPRPKAALRRPIPTLYASEYFVSVETGRGHVELVELTMEGRVYPSVPVAV
jgi:hypothetical protein